MAASKHRSRRWVLGPAVTLVASLLVLAAAEIALIVYHARKGIHTWMYVQQIEPLHGPDPELYWVNRPGLKIRPNPLNSFTQITIDSRGFRTTAPKAASPAGQAQPEGDPATNRPARTVVCLGGSTTFGYTVLQDGLTYPAQLRRILERGRGEPVEVINAAAYRYTSRDSYRMLRRICRTTPPTDIVFYHGINDMATAFLRGFQPDYRHVSPAHPPQPTKLARLLAHSHLLTTLRQRLPRRQVGQRKLFNVKNSVKSISHGTRHDAIAAFRDNIFRCRDLAAEIHANFFVVTFGFDRGALRREGLRTDHIDLIADFNNAIRQLAGEPGINIIEAAEKLQADPSIFTDGCHFTPRGTARLATVVAEGIRGKWEESGAGQRSEAGR